MYIYYCFTAESCPVAGTNIASHNVVIADSEGEDMYHSFGILISFSQQSKVLVIVQLY